MRVLANRGRLRLFRWLERRQVAAERRHDREQLQIGSLSRSELELEEHSHDEERDLILEHEEVSEDGVVGGFVAGGVDEVAEAGGDLAEDLPLLDAADADELEDEADVDGHHPGEGLGAVVEGAVVAGADAVVVFDEAVDEGLELDVVELALDPLGRGHLVPLHVVELQAEVVVRPDRHLA